MNCKPGDLAIVVQSNAGHAGKILTVLRLATRQEIINLGYRPPPFPVWVTDRDFCDVYGNSDNTIGDPQLRPLRGEPGNESWFKAAPESLDRKSVV